MFCFDVLIHQIRTPQLNPIGQRSQSEKSEVSDKSKNTEVESHKNDGAFISMKDYSEVLTVPLLVIVDGVEYRILLQSEPVVIMVKKTLTEVVENSKGLNLVNKWMTNERYIDVL